MSDPAQAVKQNAVFEQLAGQQNFAHAMLLEEPQLRAQLSNSKVPHVERQWLQRIVSMCFDRRNNQLATLGSGMLGQFDGKTSPASDQPQRRKVSLRQWPIVASRNLNMCPCHHAARRSAFPVSALPATSSRSSASSRRICSVSRSMRRSSSRSSGSR